MISGFKCPDINDNQQYFGFIKYPSSRLLLTTENCELDYYIILKSTCTKVIQSTQGKSKFVRENSVDVTFFMPVTVYLSFNKFAVC